MSESNENAPPRSIFITGAGSGIGRATAKLFASLGWFVGAADIDLTGPEMGHPPRFGTI